MRYLLLAMLLSSCTWGIPVNDDAGVDAGSDASSADGGENQFIVVVESAMKGE